MSQLLCKGCKTHGACLDEAAIKSLSQKTVFDRTFEASKVGEKSLNFETVLQELLDMRGKQGYEEKLQEIAQFIIENSAANSPSSLRQALQLAASSQYAAWSNETAEKELNFCNTRMLEQQFQ